MSEDTQALIARLWTRFQPLALERVAVVAAYADRLASTEAAPDADAPRRTAEGARTRALAAVHDLVGSLGSYGRPEGSVLAAQVEALLAAPPVDLSALRPLVARLEDEVGR